MNKNIIYKIITFFLIFNITGCSQGHIDFEHIPDANTIGKSIRMLTEIAGIGHGPYSQRVAALTVLGSQYAIKGVSQYLNEREERQAIEAANESLRKSNRNTVSWNSQKTRGETTASATYKGCRNVKQTVFKNGKQYNATTKFCRDPSSGKMMPA